MVAQELYAMDQQLSSRGEVDAILQKVLTKLLDPLPSVEELEELEHLAEQALALQNGKPLVLSKDEESIIIHPILPE
ncbi:MAG: hypothetical protein Q4B28_06060 [bacterium]|nr:hypothetical protein [bacterium]